jgi:hypothetical protein
MSKMGVGGSVIIPLIGWFYPKFLSPQGGKISITRALSGGYRTFAKIQGRAGRAEVETARFHNIGTRCQGTQVHHSILLLV